MNLMDRIGRRKQDMTTSKLIEATEAAVAKRLSADIAAERTAQERCQQCVRDCAEGIISQEQERQWLQEKGDPALAKARWRLQQARVTVTHEVVGPMTQPRLRQLSDRALQVAAELVDIHSEIATLEEARRRLGLRAPSCTIHGVDTVWLQQARARIEAAHAPQPRPNQEWKPAPRPVMPNYEPALVSKD